MTTKHLMWLTYIKHMLSSYNILISLLLNIDTDWCTKFLILKNVSIAYILHMFNLLNNNCWWCLKIEMIFKQNLVFVSHQHSICKIYVIVQIYCDMKWAKKKMKKKNQNQYYIKIVVNICIIYTKYLDILIFFLWADSDVSEQCCSNTVNICSICAEFTNIWYVWVKMLTLYSRNYLYCLSVFFFLK